MAFKRLILLSLHLATFHYQMVAQDCLEYPEIEGEDCQACVPIGWTALPGATPDIVLDDGTYYAGCVISDLSGASPGGGNMVFLGSNPIVQEGMTTTISGLSTDQEYGFGLYWEAVTISVCASILPGELLIILDGEEYEFSGAEDWEFIEICFTPSASTIEIELSINSTGFNAIVVDSPSCDDVTPCCPLIVLLEEEIYEICPGEEFLIEGQIENDEGDVIIEWTSNPSDGVNYLNTTDIISPTFSFPEDDNFNGVTYEFTLNVQDDNCTKQRILIVTVNPSEVPDFEINICELSFLEDFPSISFNGYTGSWAGDFDFEDLIGTVQEYTFSLAPGQDNCIQEYIYEIPINAPVTLTFEHIDSYCVLDSIEYTFPQESEENIEGVWNDDEFKPSDLGVGIFTFTFEADPEFCAYPFEAEIEIFEDILTTFDIPDTICNITNAIVFDSTSIEGILGYWNPLSINVDTVVGDQFNIIWTLLDTLNVCLHEFSKTITVKPKRVIDINLPELICRDNGIVYLPIEDSNDTLIGDWNISSFNPDTITGSFVYLTFTPLDNECTETYNDTIEVINNINPVFSFQTEFCSSYNDFTLPLIDDNGIEGSWTIPIIQPDLINGQITSVFTSNDQLSCYNNYEAAFTVNNLIAPLFDIPEVFCANGAEFNFPNLSINNIQGSWSQMVFDPTSFNGNNFINTFTPDVITCNELIDVIIPVVDFKEVTNSVLNASSCSANDGSIIITAINEFEFSIDNGITWQSNPSFENLSAGNYQVVVRHNNFTNCSEVFDFQITAPSAPFILMLESMNISDCGLSDGSVTCVAEGSNLEYSIDNGNSWQSNNTFSDLSVGTYIILVRADGDSNCSALQNFEINDIADVLIEDAIVLNISDCNLTNGTITILPLAPIYEYSIDGQNWQESNVFTDLDQGNYNAAIRLVQSPNCCDNKSVDVLAPDNPSIINLISSNPSDCGIEDGSISVDAAGSDLEFSIDNGISWSDNNVFSNLPSGIFNIIIREKNSPKCYDQSSTTLETPNTPQVTSFEITQPTDCISNDGSIEVFISISDVEFSIDNEANWQGNGLFENLLPENYTIIIRNTSSTDCSTSLPFEILNTPCPCNDLAIEINSIDVNCFDTNSGSIEITDIGGFYTNEDYQILWSNGSSDLLLNNLSTGWYSYEILYDQNCYLKDSVFLNAFDPITFGLLAFDPTCNEEGSIEVTDLEGGTGQFQYSLDGINFQYNQVFYNLSAGDYQVIVEDNFNCSASENITLNSDLNLSLDLPVIQPINYGETVTLNPLINEITIDSFSWSPISGILNPNNLIAQVSPEQTTEYTLTIYFGECVEMRTITVDVIENKDLYLGNTFSPNFDGNNDYFYIQSSLQNNVTVNEFKIYDRWGNLVFDKSNPEINNEIDGWDGTRNGAPLSLGVYTYIVIYSINQNKEITSGHLTLVK